MDITRHNLFNLVHKGLRYSLFDTAIKFQHADLGNKESAEGAIGQLEQVLKLFEGHAYLEDNFINEPLSHRDYAIADLFEKEHEEDERLGEMLKELISNWKKATSYEARKSKGLKLFYAFNEFMAFNLNHMNKEEIALNKSLWAHYTDVEIKAMVQHMLMTVGPEKIRPYNPWMVKAANNEEIVQWFNDIHAHAPADVYEAFYQLAENMLPTERMEHIRASVPPVKNVSPVL